MGATQSTDMRTPEERDEQVAKLTTENPGASPGSRLAEARDPAHERFLIGRTPVRLPVARRSGKSLQQARSSLSRGITTEPRPIFSKIVAGAPRNALAPNARYWLGECHYSQKRFQEAIAEFEKVVQDYPDSHKARTPS